MQFPGQFAVRVAKKSSFSFNGFSGKPWAAAAATAALDRTVGRMCLALPATGR
jgi:hypothetical protein